MADDFTFKDAAGVTRTGRSDQVGGADIPYVKIMDGTDGSVVPLAVSAEGALVRPGAPMRYGTEATTHVAPTTSWTDVVVANATRRALTLYNDGGVAVSVSFGANAGILTVPKFMLDAGAFYEMPSDAIYTGIIAMKSASGTGSVAVAEVS